MGKRKVENSTEIADLIEASKHDAYVLFECFHMSENMSSPVYDSFIITRSMLHDISAKDLFEIYMDAPFNPGEDQYCLTDIEYNVGYVIKHTKEKWNWYVNLIIENAEQFGIDNREFSQQSGSEDTEEAAIAKASAALHQVIDEITEMESTVIE